MERAAVIGLGLIGGSIAAKLRQSGVRITGCDARAERGQVARVRGLIDETGDLESVVSEAEIVVLAAPVTAIVELLPRVEAHADADALIIDTGSVKRPILSAMEKLQRPDRAVGGHPIAGKEVTGPESADPALFANRPFALVPTGCASDRAMHIATELVTRLGSRVVQCSAAEHDSAIAETSHLPQILSSLLAVSVGEDARQLSGPGLQGMIRLARSDPGLWREILILNRDSILTAGTGYAARLKDFLDALAAGESSAIDRALTAGQTVADAIAGGTAA